MPVGVLLETFSMGVPLWVLPLEELPCPGKQIALSS
jgi:hypothetical protein